MRSNREQMEKALRESESKFQSVVMLAADAIILADCEGTITFWNNGAECIFGYKASEVVGKPIAVLMPERYREAHSRGLARLGSGGEPKVVGKTVELHGLTKEGLEFPLELTLSPWESEGKTFFSAIIRDITERKRISEEILALKELNESVVESIQDGLVVVDQDFRVTLWNKAMEKISGYSSERAVGGSALDVFPYLQGVEIEKIFKSALEGQSSKWSNVSYKNSHGGDGCLNLKSFPMRADVDEVREALIVIENLSEILRLEYEVASLKDEAEKQKLLDVAKAMMTREWGLSSFDSHKFILKKSQDTRTKAVDVAKHIIGLLGSPEEKGKYLI